MENYMENDSISMLYIMCVFHICNIHLNIQYMS